MKIWKLAIVVLAVGMFSVSAIAQDTCATAVGTGVGNPVSPCGDLTPTGPLGGCTSGGGLLDSWLSFVATDTTARIRTDLNSTGTDSDYIVHSGTCAGLSPIGCSEDDSGVSAYLGDIAVKGLTVGDTYYIQLGTWSDGCPNGPYVVDVIMPNDSCGDGTVNGNDECDVDGSGCTSGECDSDCTCVPATPALPVWGLIGLGVLLLGGGATAVRRRQK
jgi:hypothetical protein